MIMKNREISRVADYGYGYVLVMRWVYLYSESFVMPDLPDYGHGYAWDFLRAKSMQRLNRYFHMVNYVFTGLNT